MKILEMAPENRPRERFSRDGAASLSDAELLALVLGKGTRGENAVDVSNRIISAYGLGRLSSLSLRELQEIKGIGPAKAVQIKAVFELNLRVKASESCTRIKNAKDAYGFLVPIFGTTSQKECFVVLHLDKRKKVIGKEVFSSGVLDKAFVQSGELFRGAIKEGAAFLIVAHNHPSGESSPSEEDVLSTRRMVEAGRILGIPVLDHLILGKDEYYSFREKNAL